MFDRNFEVWQTFEGCDEKGLYGKAD